MLLGTIASHGIGARSGDYDSIQTVTVGAGGAANISFTSIPGTYQHLQIRWIARAASNGFDGTNFAFVINDDTTQANYRMHFIVGDGSSASSGNQQATAYGNFGEIATDGNTANVYGAGVLDILDYTSTNKNKTIRHLVGRDYNGVGKISLFSGLYLATPTAVTKITISAASGNLNQYSQFALYGIKAA